MVFFTSKNYGPVKALQGIAGGLLGSKRAFAGGPTTAVLGLVLHVFIALSAAAVFHLVSRKVRYLVERPVISGLLFGMTVLLVMNVVVLPLSALHSMSWITLAQTASTPVLLSRTIPLTVAHLLCVGLPIAMVVRWSDPLPRGFAKDEIGLVLLIGAVLAQFCGGRVPDSFSAGMLVTVLLGFSAGVGAILGMRRGLVALLAGVLLVFTLTISLTAEQRWVFGRVAWADFLAPVALLGALAMSRFPFRSTPAAAVEGL